MRFIEKNPLFMQLMTLYTAYRAIIFSMLSAFLLCIIYIYFMSIFAEYVAWGIIFLTQIGLTALAIGCLYYCGTIKVEDDEDKSR